MSLEAHMQKIQQDNLSAIIKSVAKEVSTELKQDMIEFFKEMVAKKDYPPELRGDKLTAQFLSEIENKKLTADALRKRINNGWYQEGLHFYQISDKIRMWKRDALLNYTKDT